MRDRRKNIDNNNGDMLSSQQMSGFLSALRGRVNLKKELVGSFGYIDNSAARIAEMELSMIRSAYILALKMSCKKHFHQNIDSDLKIPQAPLNFSKPKTTRELTDHFAALGLRTCAPQIKSCLI